MAFAWLLAATLSPLAPSARAATITGPILKADSTPYVGTILFRPLSTPLPISPNIVTGGDFKVSTDTDGVFSVALQAGDYRVIIGADKGFLIDVPNDSATYTLISRITTALAWDSRIVPSTNLYATATSSTEGILKTYSTVGSPVVFTTNDLPTMGSYLLRHLTTAAYTTIPALQAATVPSLNRQRIFVGGAATDSDGGGGWFTYDSTNSITSDGYMVVAPNSGPGRYLREYDGPLNVLWFGATGDGTTDDAAAVQRAIDWANAPTYGYGANAYGGSTTLSVYCPPGRYLTRSTITLKGADLYGKWGGKGDWNSHTVFVCGHSGHLFTYDFNTNLRVPHIHDLYMFGNPETYQAGKVAISAVSSRTVFTVGTNSLPTLSGTGIPNFAFFFDNEGGYLGHGVISSINSSTGDVTLTTGYDNYATVTDGSGLLRTSDKVVFTPLIASEGFYSNIADPASAGSCGIFIKNTHASASGRPPRMSRLHIEKFWAGIRVGGNILDSWTDDVSIMNCKFSGLAFPRWYATSDNIYSRIYISSSYRADYDATRTNTFANSELRNAPFGVYGLGPSDHLSTCVIESASLANVCLVGTLQQSIHDVHLDDSKRYGLMAIDGYNAGTGPFSTWAQISQCFIRSPLAGVSQDSIHTNDRVAVKITGTTVGRPVRLGFSQISIVDGGGGDFDNGFDIATAPGHTVRVSQLQDTSGTVNVVGASSTKPQFLDWRAIGSADLADVGPYWPTANSWSVAASGAQVFNLQSTGAKIWANSGADPLELIRSDTGHSWGIQLSTDVLRLRNTYRGVIGLDLYADTSSVVATFGQGGYAAAPRVTQIQAELAASVAGTDVAASALNIIGSRGTGASTSGGDINFYTAVAGSSGTTPQSVAQRLVIKRDGAVRFVNKSSAPTVSVTDGDVYYDSSVPGLRVRQSGAWVTLGAAGSGGVVDGDKGDITATASGTTWTIDPGAVTYAKMQDVSAASRLLGRGSASGSGDVEEITLGTGLQLTGTVLQATIGAEIQAWDADLAALAALATGADKVPYFTGASMAALADFTSFGRTLVGSANASAARSSLGVAVGSDVQAYDAELSALASLTSAADKLPYFTGSGTAATADLTSFSRSVLASADAATARAVLGVTTNGTVASVSVVTTNGVSGTVNNAMTTPAISLTLGAITPSSVNGYTITPGSGTLGFGSGGTIAYQGGTLAQFAATTSAQLAGVLSDETGTGAAVFATSPTLVTPALGVATATSINGTAIPSSKTLVVTTDKLSALAATTSAELAGVLSDETGTGAAVFATSPTLTTPTLGTPTQANLANATNLPISTGVSGLGTGVATALGTPSSANIATAVTDETGSGALVFATSPTLVTPALGVATATSINGTAIPSSKTLVVTTDKLSALAATTSAELAGVLSDETGTGAAVFATSPTLVTPALGVATATSINGTTIPSSKTLVVTTDKLSALAATTSAELAGVLSDETGTGAAVFATSPTLTTPTLGTPTQANLANATNLPISTGVSGLGTGVATALGTPSSANIATAVTDETGSGALVFATSPTLTTPSLGVATATSINGTTIPSSKTLVVTTDKLSVHAATTSSELAGVISDETGTGALVLGTDPTLTTPTIIGTTSTDGPTLGSEFLGASGWTSTDWTGSWAAGWTHTTGNTTALTQSTAAVVSTRYQITYTVTGRTAGTFDISFGGVSNTALSATGSWGPTTTSTASLSITPTSTFDGTIVLSIKAITTPSSPNIALKSSDGTTRSEWRASSGALGNDFIGNSAGRYTTTGGFNVSVGYNSMLVNTTGSENVALGYVALQNNTTGKQNTALGFAAQIGTTSGSYNVGVGYAALYNSTTALYNTAVGFVAMYGNITGMYNVAVGANAGRFIAGGSSPLTTVSTSVFVGYDSRANADGDSNEIAIGYQAIGAGSNTATLGNTSITKTVLRGAVNIGTGPAILTGPAANTLQIGDADSASPSAQTVKFQSVIAGTSNTAGPNATLKAPASTGNAAGGSLKLQVTAPGSSGTSQNTWVDAFSVAGDANLTATFSGVVRLKSYTVATLPAAGTAGRIAYVTDATAPTYRGALTGGGAVTCLVFDNGTSWESH